MPEKEVRFHLYIRDTNGTLKLIQRGKANKPLGGRFEEVFNVNGQCFLVEDRLEPSGNGDDGDVWKIVVRPEKK